jgi:hypothetical protein
MATACIVTPESIVFKGNRNRHGFFMLPAMLYWQLNRPITRFFRSGQLQRIGNVGGSSQLHGRNQIKILWNPVGTMAASGRI